MRLSRRHVLASTVGVVSTALITAQTPAGIAFARPRRASRAVTTAVYIEVPEDWPAKAAEKYDLLNVNAGASGNAGGDA